MSAITPKLSVATANAVAESEAFKAQITRVRGLLTDDVPLAAFDTVGDFKIVLKLLGANTYYGISKEGLDRVEGKIIAFKQVEELNPREQD